MRPVILSRPENTARPLSMCGVGGSTTVSSSAGRQPQRAAGGGEFAGAGESRRAVPVGSAPTVAAGPARARVRPKRPAVAATAGLRPASRPPDTEAGSDNPASLGWDKLDRVADTAAAADPVAGRAAGTAAAALAADRAAGQVAAGPVPDSHPRAAAAAETDRSARLRAVAAAVRRRKCCRIGLLPARQRKFRRSKAARRRTGLWTAGYMGAMGSTASLGCAPG